MMKKFMCAITIILASVAIISAIYTFAKSNRVIYLNKDWLLFIKEWILIFLKKALIFINLCSIIL